MCLISNVSQHLLWWCWEGGDELADNGLHFRVVFIEMFGQGAHEDDDALAYGVLARRAGGARQELLKHRQQHTHIVLANRMQQNASIFFNLWK